MDESTPALPRLYYAVERNDIAEVRRLLEEGADPNDGESVYHGAQWNRRECLELLLAHGADLSGAHPIYRNTPLYFLAGHTYDHDGQADWIHGMTWLLEHGADPRVTSTDAAETPLHQVVRWSKTLAATKLLLVHGADPNQRRADGSTPFAVSVRWGNTAANDLLRQHGASADALTAMDTFVGACRRGDESEARRLADAIPDWRELLTPADRGAMGAAIWEDRPDAIRLMADLGFDLSWEADEGGTPLHWAAWHGKVEIVRLLLDLGAPVNVRDSTYGSSPIAWACHGSTNCRTDDDAYCAVVEMLIDAGAEHAVAINKDREPPTEFATPAVAAVLARRGFGR